ncbi:MAG: MCE family protein [Alphaproteobacteria bacterium]|nr:MCE family protein [Alphaproteobacteria bacterium]
METRASYLLVGAFALLAMAGFVVAVIWMAGINFQENFARYDIYFDGSVTGLKPGNAVRYRGVPVGVVREMRINPDNVEQVQVTIEVPESTPVKEDTVAALEFQGITGVAYVQLSGGTHDAAALKPKAGQELPVIGSKPSQLQELFESAPELVQRVTALVDRANLLLNARNRENMSRIISNVGVFTDALAERSEDVGTIIADTSRTMKHVRTAAEEVEGAMKVLHGSTKELTTETTATIKDFRVLVSSLSKLAANIDQEMKGVGGETKQALSEVRKTAVEFRRAAFVLADLIEDNRDPVDTFASSGLYELTQLLAETRVLVGALTRISAQIESDPSRFLFGRTRPGVEVK